MKTSNGFVIIIFIPILLTFTGSCRKEDDNPEIMYGSVTDIDGNIYKTVKIGNQWWMAENLKTTRCNDGTSIPFVTDNTAWSNLTTPGYCWYSNDQVTYGNIYGALYNWYTVQTGNLCPDGWHVPADAEWTNLTEYLGGDSIAGGKIKETGITHWANPNTGATNETGFSALPGGSRSDYGFGFINTNVLWWSATEYDTNLAWYRFMYHYTTSVYKYYRSKKLGFSVRCIKD